MKLPAILMASLLTATAAAQTTKPVVKTTKKTVKKSADVNTVKLKKNQPVAKKDTIVRNHGYCPACGMG